VDMTPEMLTKSRGTKDALDLERVEFREGLLEELPVEDEWADVVISNGVINLCADKRAVFGEAFRVLRPGGSLQFADIANGKPLPSAAVCEIDLWTGCIAGGLPLDDWCSTLQAAGFEDLSISAPIDAFGGSGGEQNARAYDVFAYVFLARKPG
jgi:arsenite methyltransferase